MTDTPLAVRVRITGRVQGVGYRHWTHLRASRAGLTGFVRNRTDGSVEAVFVGVREEVDDMVARCRVGPRTAEVANVAVEPCEEVEFADFSVMPTA